MLISARHIINEAEAQQKETSHVGHTLATLRLARGLSLEHIATETRISLVNLQAIEHADYAKLPPDAFTRGLITLYGNALGKDGRELARQFFLDRDKEKKNSFWDPHSISSLRYAPKKLAEPAHISSAAVAITILALIVLSFFVFYWYFSWQPFSFVLNAKEHGSEQAVTLFHPADPSTRQTDPRSPLALENMSSLPPEFVINRQKWPLPEPNWQHEWANKPSPTLLLSSGASRLPKPRATVSPSLHRTLERPDTAPP